MAGLRANLAAIYAAKAPVEWRRQQRDAQIEAARASYARLREGWPEPPWFDSWFEPGLNNARLAALSSYEDYVPAFRALLAREGGDLARFYASVEALGAREPEVRAMERSRNCCRAPRPVSASAPASGSCP